ncbi:nitroreductase family protein [Nocardioides litoris]|uniref:nitroreductase family protein n=1 Tax=Nocardioides litoris TaxID=1926648 RepID=UPI0011214033|nr:nitroreductase family protein [Nocardioides litoris]
MELYDVMRTTPATREFTDDPVDDETLRRILDHARFAPSGGNRQGAHVVVVREQATRQALVELYPSAVKRYVAQVKAGEAPWNSVHPPGPSPEEIEATEVPDRFTGPVLEAPVVLVFFVDLSVVASMDQDLDRVGVISGGSVYPLVWNVLLAARNEGLGGTITTMAVVEEAKVKELFGVPDTYAVAAVVPLGRPVKVLTKLKRQPIEEFVTRERYDGPAL